MDQIECVVIGAGVVGLAISRELAQSGRDTVIVERERTFGAGISSRNSEVIHAGIYYPKDSLKARLCLEGNRLLYDYCESRNIEHRRCGKLIVASSVGQMSALRDVSTAAEANGVLDLQWLDKGQTLRLEPELNAAAALLSPSTGIVDSHGYMLSLLGEAENAGGMLAYATNVDRMAIEDGSVLIWTNGDSEPVLRSRTVINASGLESATVARSIDNFPEIYIPSTYLAKGSYFALSGHTPFRKLIYPIPEPGGLGIHMTLDLTGQARFGPDVEWIDQVNFDVDSANVGKFYDAVRKYWPGLRDGRLSPGYSGIRPKISPPGAPAVDFRIDGRTTHGVPGVINLFGIESPGLTASLAIAKEVLRMVQTDAE